jgi:xylulokinase
LAAAAPASGRQAAPGRPEARLQGGRPGRRRSGEGCLLGIDIGTTGSKAIAFLPDGRAMARGYADYALQVGPGGTAELDAAAVLEALRRAVRAAAAEAAAAGAGPVVALAAAAQGEAFTPVADDLRPLRPAIVTFDRRGQAGADELRQAGWEQRTEAAGLPMSFITTAAKLAALRRAEPDLYRDAARFLCFEDLLAAHLTGNAAGSDSLLQRTWLLDRHTRQWDSRAVADLGLSGRLAEVVPMGHAIGRVSAAGAQAFGLPAGCLVVAGAHDQTAALVGAGAFLPGFAAHAIGTVDCLSVTLRDGEAAPFVARGYGLGLHPLPGLAATLAFGFGGGSLLAWARALTGAADVGTLLRDVPESPGTAFAVPFWSGSGTPDLDAEDRGALFGLTLESTRGDVVAALLRGMALEGRRNLDVLHGLGVEVRECRLVGGGARSATWSQLRADVAGRSYVEMPQHDAGCLGAAMLAAVGAGIHPGCSEAGDAMVRTGVRFEPRPEAAAAYDQLFPAYIRAVAATRAARP